MGYLIVDVMSTWGATAMMLNELLTIIKGGKTCWAKALFL